MRITLDATKTLEENAASYFEMAKQAKKKAEGAREALEDTRRKLVSLDRQLQEEADERASRRPARKREWYEKFRWFFTSEGLLVVSGRDAQTNEIVVKKHTKPEDVVFHTEMPGSPFSVIQKGSEPVGQASLEETAQFTACYSKAWKAGRSIADVFYVNPDQVSKQAQSGEYIARGAFMIYGKKNFMTVPLKLFVGRMEDGKVMAGPEAAVKAHCSQYAEIQQGNDKISSVAKRLKAKLDADDLDDILKVIPQGSRINE